MDMALEQELETFHRELPELLADARNVGRYVLIHGDKVGGVYATSDQALEAGYEKFGLDPFLVKLIAEHEPIIHFARYVRCP
jgi:phosphoserine phosphatase